jgi:hypothetical protein
MKTQATDINYDGKYFSLAPTGGEGRGEGEKRAQKTDPASKTPFFPFLILPFKF